MLLCLLSLVHTTHPPKKKVGNLQSLPCIFHILLDEVIFTEVILCKKQQNKQKKTMLTHLRLCQSLYILVLYFDPVSVVYNCYTQPPVLGHKSFIGFSPPCSP